jgi:hypothetical protein
MTVWSLERDLEAEAARDLLLESTKLELGAPCPCCQRPVPAGRFDFWRERTGVSLRDMARALSAKLSRPMSVNLVFRLSHHSPAWTPKGHHLEILGAMMEMTGLDLEAFQEPRPDARGHYFEKGSRAGLPRARLSEEED